MHLLSAFMMTEHRHVGSNNFNLFSRRSRTIFTLYEEGQVKMQSRLEEEEEAKAALMSRIQRLTKLILVSSKNTIPGLSDITSNQQHHSLGEDDRLDMFQDPSSMLVESDRDSPSSGLCDPSPDLKYRRSTSKWSDEQSPPRSSVTELIQVGIHISG